MQVEQIKNEFAFKVELDQAGYEHAERIAELFGMPCEDFIRYILTFGLSYVIQKFHGF